MNTYLSSSTLGYRDYSNGYWNSYNGPYEAVEEFSIVAGENSARSAIADF